MNTITLTGKQIHQLYKMVAVQEPFDKQDKENLEVEITIAQVGTKSTPYAYYTEYPEEGHVELATSEKEQE